MALPTQTYVFESCLQNTPPLPAPSTRLDEIIQTNLKMATRKNSLAPENPVDPAKIQSRTVFNDMGDYMTQTAGVWAHLTENLVKGPHIEEAVYEIHKRMQTENRCADLSPVTAMDLDLVKLRKIMELTAQYSKDVEKIWRQRSNTEEVSAKAPYPGQSGIDMKSSSMPAPGMMTEDNKGAVRRMLPGTAQQDHVSPPDDGSGSDESDDEDDERFSQAKMDALKTRGKGDHYCPKGYQCTKGGVDKDGNLVQFDRNSAFAQHCNKHRKPYRCNLEGCPNPAKKRRFARRDGLERHQKHVPHIITHPVAAL